MIEAALYFALGALCVSLLLFVILPIVSGRARRLAIHELERQAPVSLSEITAQKDQMRARFAVELNRQEQRADQLQVESQQHHVTAEKWRIFAERVEQEFEKLNSDYATLKKKISTAEVNLEKQKEIAKSALKTMTGKEKKRLFELEDEVEELRSEKSAANTRTVAMQTELNNAQSRIAEMERHMPSLEELNLRKELKSLAEDVSAFVKSTPAPAAPPSPAPVKQPPTPIAAATKPATPIAIVPRPKPAAAVAHTKPVPVVPPPTSKPSAPAPSQMVAKTPPPTTTPPPSSLAAASPSTSSNAVPSAPAAMQNTTAYAPAASSQKPSSVAPAPTMTNAAAPSTPVSAMLGKTVGTSPIATTPAEPEPSKNPDNKPMDDSAVIPVFLKSTAERKTAIAEKPSIARDNTHKVSSEPGNTKPEVTTLSANPASSSEISLKKIDAEPAPASAEQILPKKEIVLDQAVSSAENSDQNSADLSTPSMPVNGKKAEIDLSTQPIVNKLDGNLPIDHVATPTSNAVKRVRPGKSSKTKKSGFSSIVAAVSKSNKGTSSAGPNGKVKAGPVQFNGKINVKQSMTSSTSFDNFEQNITKPDQAMPDSKVSLTKDNVVSAKKRKKAVKTGKKARRIKAARAS